MIVQGMFTKLLAPELKLVFDIEAGTNTHVYDANSGLFVSKTDKSKVTIAAFGDWHGVYGYGVYTSPSTHIIKRLGDKRRFHVVMVDGELVPTRP